MRHPVESTIRQAVYNGTAPDRDELAGLGLSSTGREQVTTAIREGLELREAGNRGRANEHALRASKEILAGLPESQRDPGYLDDPNADLPSDPAALAALVPPGVGLSPR